MKTPKTIVIAGIEVLARTASRWPTRPVDERDERHFRLGFEGHPLPEGAEDWDRWWHYRGSKAALDWEAYRRCQAANESALAAGARARRRGVPVESAPNPSKHGKAYRRDWVAGWREEERRMYEEALSPAGGALPEHREAGDREL